VWELWFSENYALAPCEDFDANIIGHAQPYP